jgi:hypothetical protein
MKNTNTVEAIDSLIRKDMINNRTFIAPVEVGNLLIGAVSAFLANIEKIDEDCIEVGSVIMDECNRLPVVVCERKAGRKHGKISLNIHSQTALFHKRPCHTHSDLKVSLMLKRERMCSENIHIQHTPHKG